MFSWSVRANTVLALGVTFLVVLCAMASYTDSLHRSLPKVDLQILQFGPLERLWTGEDKSTGSELSRNLITSLEDNMVTLLLNVTADLESVFTWNTKQLFVFVAAEYSSADTAFNQIILWDTIIEKKEDAKIQQQILTHLSISKKHTRDGPFSYPFQGKDLQGREFNLSMYWNVMPISGIFRTNKVIVSGFRLPQRYS